MIVIDTDFLSSFFKINRVDLIFKAFKTKEIIIASTVLHELERAPFYSVFLKSLYSREQRFIIQNVERYEQSDILGAGEMGSIFLAEKEDALLLMNDQTAVRVAESKGIAVLDIPSFLFYCKKNSFISQEEMKIIISGLKEKDYYEFNNEVMKILLE